MEDQKTEAEQLFAFMLNLLEGGFQPSPSFFDKAYEFACELAEKVLYADANTTYISHSVVMMQGSVLLKQGFALLAADSQRRAQEEQEAVAMQKNGPRIHRLN